MKKMKLFLPLAAIWLYVSISLSQTVIAPANKKASFNLSVTSDRPAIEKTLEEEETAACVGQGDASTCHTRFYNSLKFKVVPLDPNGALGMIVDFSDSGICGSSGCTLIMLRRIGSDYQKVLDGFGYRLKFKASTTNGYYDVEEDSKGKDILSVKKTTYIWSGSSYVNQADPGEGKQVTSEAKRLDYLAILKREKFAEQLTLRSSKQIYWCAAGARGELLAGYITTSQLSPNTFALIGTHSSLYPDLYRRGFRFSGVWDRDQLIKTVGLSANGPVASTANKVSDRDGSFYDYAFGVLIIVANGLEIGGDRAKEANRYRNVVDGQAITSCIPDVAPDSCPAGQKGMLMPGVGSICTSR